MNLIKLNGGSKTIKEFLSDLAGAVLLFGLIYFALVFGACIEEEVRCNAGAVEFCLTEN